VKVIKAGVAHKSFDAPHDLVFSGRSIENEIGRRHVTRGADRLKRTACLLVEVQVCVTNLADLFFGPVSRSFSYWIHANENVGSGQILLVKPGLKRRTRDGLGRKNLLHGLLLSSIPDEHGYKVAARDTPQTNCPCGHAECVG
jgi:hypothetical protein